MVLVIVLMFVTKVVLIHSEFVLTKVNNNARLLSLFLYELMKNLGHGWLSVWVSNDIITMSASPASFTLSFS